MILQEVWGPEYGTETQYLRVYASQLRKKLADDPARPRLVTEPGVGYRLIDRDADRATPQPGVSRPASTPAPPPTTSGRRGHRNAQRPGSKCRLSTVEQRAQLRA